jgi:hypothetical protein
LGIEAVAAADGEGAAAGAEVAVTGELPAGLVPFVVGVLELHPAATRQTAATSRAARKRCFLRR